MVRSRQSFLGKGAEWSYCVERSLGGMAASANRWRSGMEWLPAVHNRFKGVQVECDDWRNVMLRFDTPETLHYLDPPYHPSTRVNGGYKHEFTERDHEELIARLLVVRGMVVLSGYAHEMYEPLERAGWKRVDYKTRTHTSDCRAQRVESLWLSPSARNCPTNRTLFLSPAERRRQGAYRSHRVRVAATTRRVVRTIARFRATGKKVTMSSVGRAAKVSREHLSRKYGHLFRV
jgi:DNA adenine methylase